MSETYVSFFFTSIMIAVFFLTTCFLIGVSYKKTTALITKNHAEYMRIETEKQKTIAEFLRSVKTGEEGRNVKEN